MISRRLLTLNVALVGVAVWGAVQVRAGWTDFDKMHQPNLLNVPPDMLGVRTGEKPLADPASGEWTEAASKNPFSFDRNDANLMAQVAAPEKVGTPPKPVLFGVIDLGSGPIAMLGPAGAKRYSPPTVKQGDTFQGWTVTEIRNNAVTVEANGVEESLQLGTATIDRDAGKTPGAGATVVSTTSSQPVAPLTSSSPATSTSTAADSPADWRPGQPAPPGHHVVVTPFGAPYLERDK